MEIDLLGEKFAVMGNGFLSQLKMKSAEIASCTEKCTHTVITLLVHV